MVKLYPYIEQQRSEYFPLSVIKIFRCVRYNFNTSLKVIDFLIQICEYDWFRFIYGPKETIS